MILHESRDKIRDLMSIFVYKVICASEMGQIDIKKDAETVLTSLLTEVYDYKNLRNLNATERDNYPAIDLADDDARVAFQITSQKDLNKVKKTLQMFVDHELYKKYDTLFIYVLTEKQGSYSVDPCNEIVQGRFEFDPKNNILSYRDLLKKIGAFEVGKTNNILEILEANIGEGKIFQSILGQSTVSTEIVDEHIDKEIDRLRKARFFPEFDEIEYASVLGTRVSEGELRGGSYSERARALVWCARILLASEEELNRAEEYMSLAKTLRGDTRIAEAFISSQKGDRQAALGLLADVASSDSRFTAYRSASFKIVGNLDGPQKAITWLDDVSLEASDLDPEGKLVLLSYQFELCQWKAAGETARALRDRDLEEAPVLHFMKAMAYLLNTVPVEFRNSVFHQVPFDAATFPMDSRANAIEARRTARNHFAAATEAARELGCHRAATIPDRFAIWLELEDSEYCDRGRQRLADRLGELESTLYLVPLGLEYGISLDMAKVEQEIERQRHLQGDISPDAAFARLALASMQRTPEAAANYVDLHYDTISSHIDAKAIRASQIGMFARAGMSEKANRILELLLEEGLTEVEEGRLRIAIEEGIGKDTLEARNALFSQTDSIIDLEPLVNSLGIRREWRSLCEYGEILFQKTYSLQNTERLVNTLHFAGKSAQAIELLESNVDILSQSTDLQVLYCWALFHEGELLRARCELAKLEVDWEDENYRALQISMAIALGDWDSLSVYVAKEYQAKEERGAHDLIRAAQLALCVGSPYAKQLALEAAARENNDAGVLASVHFLATKADWESEPQFVQCLHRAVELSGDDGPFLKFTLKDILDKKPDWDRQESNAREVLNRGEGPMVFAGPFLNKSLTNFTLFPALANSTERDLRRKVGIPAFSGQRQPTPFVAGGTVGLDYTTLLTLVFLDLLDKVFDAFDTVYVPHSALAWLFEERQNASFHQPSRIKDARRVLDMLTSGLLEKVSPSTMVDRELSDYVGDDLATLIAEAENAKLGDTQRLVVRPSPVYKADSLGEEEADLISHSSVLVSCQAVVEKLSHMAEITDSVEKNALAYLQLREKPWPYQPEIADKAILYLDDLAVFYFLHTGILEKLSKTKFRLFVSPSVIFEFNALVAYERFSDEVIVALEDLREVVSQGIESGKVKVGKWHNIDGWEEQPISEHQISGILALAEACDAIIADDRFFNQWPQIELNGAQAPLYSTMNLLDALTSTGSISPEKRLELRTSLRRAGYFFVPVGEDELTCHLNTAEVKNGKVKENAHLRAIRESILHVRMNYWLQLPREGVWLHTIFEVFVNVLRSIWRAGAEIPSVEARSDWILDLLDVSGWAHCFEPVSRNEIIKAERAKIIFMLLTPLDANVPLNIREAHWEWLEGRVLAPIKELEPDLYTLIVDLEKRQISEFADNYPTRVDKNDG